MERTVYFKNPQGLHCRPSSALVNLSKKFKAEVFIIKDHKKAKTTEIFDLLSLGLTCGNVQLEASGEESQEALNAIEKFLNECEVYD